MADDIREELAKVIDPEAWLLRWSSERRRDERQFAAREIADAVLASPVIARIRAEQREKDARYVELMIGDQWGIAEKIRSEGEDALR